MKIIAAISGIIIGSVAGIIGGSVAWTTVNKDKVSDIKSSVGLE